MDQSASLALLRRLAAGEQAALGEFYDLFAGLVNAVALRVLRDVAEAEDVVQEVFVQIWRQAARYDPGRGSPEAWVSTLARTRSIDRLRARVARTRPSAQGNSDLAASTNPPNAAETLAVRTALGELPAEQRRVLELAYFEGLSQTEIARRLDQPLGTIKTRTRAAMLRLRAALEPLA
jgi:RNA polymerase sigma-70 factor (ECF subfamily)